jgi:hypothetical protein
MRTDIDQALMAEAQVPLARQPRREPPRAGQAVIVVDSSVWTQ